MKGRHDYSPTCNCYRCKGIRNSPTMGAVTKAVRKRRFKERYATREEQHARYIDCGPGNWDDK